MSNPDFILVPGENGDELLEASDFSVSKGWVRSPFVSTKMRTPNTSSRMGSKIDWIAIHYTAGANAVGAAKWLCNQQAKASAHFVMDQEGKMLQLASLDVRTWHVGRGQFHSNGRLLTSRCDRSAIGIELANPGPVEWDQDQNRWEYYVGRHDKLYDHVRYGEPVQATLEFSNGNRDDGMWAPYPKEQIAWLAWLCANLVQEHDIPVNRIVGHESAARPLGRKMDPGPAFPWRPFYEITCAYLEIPVPDDVDRFHNVNWR